jgi:hypothetical protein
MLLCITVLQISRSFSHPLRLTLSLTLTDSLFLSPSQTHSFSHPHRSSSHCNNHTDTIHTFPSESAGKKQKIAEKEKIQSLSSHLTYSISSFAGFVSSNLMCVTPLYAFATPKLKQIDFACPRCRYPLGSRWAGRKERR